MCVVVTMLTDVRTAVTKYTVVTDAYPGCSFCLLLMRIIIIIFYQESNGNDSETSAEPPPGVSQIKLGVFIPDNAWYFIFS